MKKESHYLLIGGIMLSIAIGSVIYREIIKDSKKDVSPIEYFCSLAGGLFLGKSYLSRGEIKEANKENGLEKEV